MARSKPDTVSQLIRHLRDNLESLRREMTAEELTAHRRNLLNKEIQNIGREIEELLREFDPIKSPSTMFDPSNPEHVGLFIALALVAQSRIPLSEVGDFYGAGVYAIYYHGPNEAYAPISGKEVPIYVGKADPANPTARTPKEQGTRLSGRLKDHSRSIRKAKTTLRMADFTCRFLVIQSGWQKSAETFLINFFHPIWNTETSICWGVGKHGDSAEMRSHPRSPWDTLHPGREWAQDSPEDQVPEAEIRKNMAKHFKLAADDGRLFSEMTDVLDAFVSGLKFSDLLSPK